MSKESEALNRLKTFCLSETGMPYKMYSLSAPVIEEDASIVEQALKRNEPMKPIYVEDCSYVGTACPSCRGYNVRDEEYTIKWKYCPDCGQRLDWSDK